MRQSINRNQRRSTKGKIHCRHSLFLILIICRPKANMSARPQISLTSCMNKDVKVELVREPVAPPSEDSIGFEPNWRETLRLERVSLLENNENAPMSPHLSTSASSDEFFTPQAPSPKPLNNPAPVPPPPVFSSPQPQFFDEAIVFMTPETE